MAATNYAKSVVYKTQRPGTVDRFTYLQSAKANALRGQELPQTKLLDMDIVSIRSAAKQRENLLKTEVCTSIPPKREHEIAGVLAVIRHYVSHQFAKSMFFRLIH